MMHLNSSSYKQRGVSLIEVLVTALIMGVGLIGMASLQSKSAQFNQGAYLRSQANLLAYDIAERMRTNRNEAITGSVADLDNEKAAVPNPYETDYATTEASGSNTSDKDLAEWKQNLANYLGDTAQGKIACDVTTKECTISIRWAEPGENIVDKDDDEILDPDNEFVYVTSF